MNKKLIMIIFLSAIVIFGISVFAFMQLPEFGKDPSGERLERVKKSPNYKDGAFQNLNPTPVITEDEGSFSILKRFISNNSPVDVIPSEKIDLINLDPKKDVLVWFGHSSYFIQIDGKKILVDPVLSGSASPFSFMINSFKGTDPYTTGDIPEIDYLLITHNHWDHLDYQTVIKLKSKIKNIITPLGVGEDFEYWGFDKNIITETDWVDETILLDGFILNTTPDQHFSGRNFKRNQTLWASYVLQTPTFKIFIGGDGGYGLHFSEIGKKFGPFDLAVLEDGQYNKSWKYIHMAPSEVLQAAKDLNTKRLLPVHNSKFNISIHPWAEPLEMITKLDKDLNIPLITPMIGEQVNLKDNTQIFKEWWKGLK